MPPPPTTSVIFFEFYNLQDWAVQTELRPTYLIIHSSIPVLQLRNIVGVGWICQQCKKSHSHQFQAISSHCQPFPVTSIHSKPFPSISSHFLKIPAISSHFNTFPGIFRHVQPFPATLSHIRHFQLFPVISGLLELFFKGIF